MRMSMPLGVVVSVVAMVMVVPTLMKDNVHEGTADEREVKLEGVVVEAAHDLRSEDRSSQRRDDDRADAERGQGRTEARADQPPEHQTL